MNTDTAPHAAAQPRNGSALAAVPPTTAEIQVLPGFDSSAGFDLLQRQAKVFANSDLLPPQFKNNLPNCIIGMEMARRMGANPMAVFQNLYIVHGKPGWSSTFIIASINSGGRFTPLRFEFQSAQGKDDWGCRAFATEKETNERLDGPWVTWAMAKAEGWVDKSGSKWKTMPELMFRYRAATFWGRLYCPETLMGMQTAEELEDITATARIANAKPVQDAAETERLFGRSTQVSAPAGEEPAPTTAAEARAAVDTTPEPAAAPQSPTGAPTAKEHLLILIEEAAFNEPSFEKFLRGRELLSKAESVRSVSEAKAAVIVGQWQALADDFQEGR